ncbi:MAG: DNA-3-methyladenine glycosylase 2 family protein [Actinomycetota bacterium]|nr:DNA-3-methyladenine glycosylase 2 family protein [Actinomycetota bacterium]
MSDFALEPRGPFDIASAARFIAGWPPAARPEAADGDQRVVRLGFLVDDWSGHAGVVLSQPRPDGPVSFTVTSSTAADPERVRDQAARIVSLDHDGRGYAELAAGDEVLRPRARRSGWLRPVLFHSPYEAACWAVLSARIRQSQAARIRDELAAAHGAELMVDGEKLPGFPAPERLLAVESAPGLSDEKVRRLHGVAEAALEGRLDRELLLAAPGDEALAALQEIRGIGPFWATGILLRAVGTTDVVTLAEQRVRVAAGEAYGTPEVAEDDEAFLALAERWRPFRTWVAVMLRATA